VIKETLREYENEPMYASIRFNYNANDDFSFIGSKQMIKNIIQNLIRNAFQHGGHNIKIKIWLEDNSLHFKDNGRGITEQNLKNLFKSFQTTSEKGNGIGLAFCSTVMKMMGGTMECRSLVNSYTEFILNFPNYYNKPVAKV
jgi:signal transduction histidine kinase